MSGFTIVVLDGGVPSYVAGRHEAREAADSQVSSMADATYEEDGRTMFVFDGSDEIVVVDEKARYASAWSRGGSRSARHFTHVDCASFLDLEAADRRREFIGFQITDLEGRNIKGTEEDPFQLEASHVLKDAAVLTAKEWAADSDYLVVEVFRDGIDEPVFVDEISTGDDFSMSPGIR